ncbi:DUF3800 domain-containing protein [bacterium]|nr:DUF3800 domain-containing protein [bacterium]
MKYRMYVDEVGNSDLKASSEPNHRYLSLTGVILELGYVDAKVFPALEDLKRRYFGSHPDDPIVLHRKELLNRKPPFMALRDPEVALRFDRELLLLLGDLEYRVITVVIDKREQVERYQTWRYDPYHYCLKVLLERYVLWLGRNRAQGDVMAESRGGWGSSGRESQRCSKPASTTEGGEAGSMAGGASSCHEKRPRRAAKASTFHLQSPGLLII